MTGAAPVPVPPPSPTVRKTMSEFRSASPILSRSSTADCRPTPGFAPAPSPFVTFSPIWILVGARLLQSAWRSVFTAMNFTPWRPESTMRLTAFPPPPPIPTTLMPAGLAFPSENVIRFPAFIGPPCVRGRRGARDARVRCTRHAAPPRPRPARARPRGARNILRAPHESRRNLRAGGAAGGADPGPPQPEAERALVEPEDARRVALVAAGERERLHEDPALDVAQSGIVRREILVHRARRGVVAVAREGEVRGDDETAGTDERGALHDAAQLADVAVPAVAFEREPRFAGEPGRLAAERS